MGKVTPQTTTLEVSRVFESFEYEVWGVTLARTRPTPFPYNLQFSIQMSKCERTIDITNIYNYQESNKSDLILWLLSNWYIHGLWLTD